MAGEKVGADTLARFEEELEVLRARRRDLAEGMGDDDPGDRADASVSISRAADLAWVDDRIAATIDKMERFRRGSLYEGALPDGAVVTLRYPDDGSTVRLRAVAIAEEVGAADETGAITPDSPLARALAGRTPGDRISYQTPAGTIHAEVVAIDV